MDNTARTGGTAGVKKRSRQPVETQNADLTGHETAPEGSSIEAPAPVLYNPDDDEAVSEPSTPLADNVASGQVSQDPNSSNVVPPEEPSFALTGPAETIAPLEQRVRRLEETMREIQETRIATDRPAAVNPPPALTVPPLNLVVAQDVAVPPPIVAPPVSVPPPLLVPAPEPKRSWLLTEMLSEARAIQFMFFDPRYRMSWGGRLLPLVLLAAFLTIDFWLPFVKLPGIGWILEKAVELMLTYVLFKVLGHEARRYRSTAPDLPPSLRL
jgi:hypothetical protein